MASRLLLLLLCAVTSIVESGAAPWKKGIVFGADEWAAPTGGWGSPSAAASLAALAATGADHVRILTTQYQDYINSTVIYPVLPPSPLASPTLEQVRGAVRAAHALGLAVLLAPILDPSWDIPRNGRSITPPAGAAAVSRLQIGAGFTEAQWGAWFTSYAAYVLPLAQLAHDEGVEMFEVCSELDVALTTRGAQWRALIAAVRSAYSGPLYVAANTNTLQGIDFLDALDAVGVDAYYGLGAPLQLGVAPSVDDLVAAWQPIRDALAALANASGKPVLITEVGYQSRPSCHVRPWGTVVHDPLDDSAWIEDHDMACQANAYEALLRVFTPEPWFAGVFWWLWRADASHGGTYDSDFTPHGKPAEEVLRRWYGGSLSSDPTGALAVAAAVRGALPAHPATHAGTRRKYQGYVFGGPDQWSSPYYRFDSSGAAASLEAMQTAAGADTAEIIVQWYVSSVNSTEVYPVEDPSSALRTSTDDELRAIIGAARGRGLQTILTLMLDPQWDLVEQNWCRGNADAPGYPQCKWRGEIGIYWGTDCSPASQWAAFFRGYTAAIVHYARLANETGVDAFLLSHELQQAVTVCPDLWLAQLAAVRAVFSGRVSTAFNPDGPAILPPAVAAAPWVQALDFIGVDCYFAPPLPPWPGSGGLSPADVHPPLPWQDLQLDTLLAAFGALMPPFAALAAATGGKQIVCTEVGWASRPWTYAYRAGTPRLDGEDCSVWDQCVSTRAQALAYQAFLQTYYAQPWFGGVTFWDWRADPTAGGASDDGFAAAGKEAANVTRAFWGAQRGAALGGV